MTKPTPPTHLRDAGRALWAAIVAEFAPDPREAAILTAAAESADRVADARVAIDADGVLVPGRFGPRVHPAASLERDSRAAVVRALAALGVGRADAVDLADASATSFPRGSRRARRSIP